MQKDTAWMIAGQWLSRSGLDPDVQQHVIQGRQVALTRAFANFLPETEDWTVLGSAGEPFVVAVGDEALFRGTGTTDDGGAFAFAMERIPIDQARVVARVTEQLIRDGTGTELRTREWHFDFGEPQIDTLSFTAEEYLVGPKSERPGDAESFGRALALACGWTLFPDPKLEE